MRAVLLSGLILSLLSNWGGDKFSSEIWKPITRFRPSPDVQRAIYERGDEWAVHRLEDGSGRLNLDYYSVNVTRLPTVNGKLLTAEELLMHVRKNFSHFMNNDVARFEPFQHEDEQKWNASNPSDCVGAVLLIWIHLAKGGRCNVQTLPNWACPTGLTFTDLGCVVVAESTRTRFRFSTVKAGSGWGALNDRQKPGAHPVSGNREFGFTNRQSGGWAFYSIGSDRATRPMDEFWGHESLRDAGFLAGDALWRSYQSRLVEFINENGGSAEVGFAESARYDWHEAQKPSGVYGIVTDPPWTKQP